MMKRSCSDRCRSCDEDYFANRIRYSVDVVPGHELFDVEPGLDDDDPFDPQGNLFGVSVRERECRTRCNRHGRRRSGRGCVHVTAG